MCSLSSAFTWSDLTHYVEKFGPSVYCGVGIAVGLVFAFYGYRLFKLTLFLCGFVVAGLAAYFALTAHVNLEMYYIWGISIAAGLVGGLLLLFLWTIGVFVLGAMMGFELAVLAMTTRTGGLLTIAWTRYVVYGGAPLVFGILAVVWEKFFIALSTSVFGAFTVIACVDYFAGSAGGGFYGLIPFIVQERPYDIDVTAVTYAELAACAILAIFSCGIQLFFTGRRYDHRQGHSRTCCGSRDEERYEYHLITN